MADEKWKPSVVQVETSRHQGRVAEMASTSASQMEERNGGQAPTAAVEPAIDFARSVVRSLGDSPRWLDCRYLYDAAGSHIFEHISEQPEYYLTRTEGAILAALGLDIAALTGRVTIIELGSGSSVKTRLLLEAYRDLYGDIRYTPVDISLAVLEHAEDALATRYPEIEVDSLHGTYDEAFPLFSKRSPAMLLFLGSTLGNLNEEQSYEFWLKTAASLQPGDYCLLGIDINEDVDSINAAYNDKAGWSQAFTRNLFERMNRELGAGIEIDAIEHEAALNADRFRVEVFARFSRAQSIYIEPLDTTLEISAGEKIMTEISRKFLLQEIIPYLEGFGFMPEQVYTDSSERFAVLLLRR